MIDEDLDAEDGVADRCRCAALTPAQIDDVLENSFVMAQVAVVAEEQGAPA
ncbi:hypothetical protein [Asanoa siamensis]|uniref:Uncharacterized protein n=1 Tax=Asanoa siamensis TaxID=926357 RepID=A0ABQ4CXC0_9ACTN|nr:hypothetical protein [Asanoa siamensis]GIF75653.1 hypothetical protein Asi02nite_51710 [Asanoa siamensis]